MTSRRRHKSFSGDHVAVAGFFGTNTGLSRAANLIALSLERSGSTVTRIDIAPYFSSDPIVNSGYLLARKCAKLKCSDLVYVANPNCPIYTAFPLRWLTRRYVVGHWIWELERAPDLWATQACLYDEIWTPTELVKAAIGISSVKVFPYAPGNDPLPKPTRALRTTMRASLGVSERIFVVGYSFSALSNYYRKNPEAAVRAFQLAFPGDQNVRLYLRCPDIDLRPAECKMLENIIGPDERIRILRRDSIAQFYATIDLYLSTSRAEGYGLNLVEAAQCGIPVIATGWRVAPDIASLPGVELAAFSLVDVDDPQGHYANLPGAKWAAPDIGDVAARLMARRADHGRRSLTAAAPARLTAAKK